MKPYTPRDRLTLTDAHGTALGTVELDAVAEGLLLGTFRPAPEFSTVAELFREFEECVEAAALAVLPGIEERIAALALRVSRAGEAPVAAGDVQIYSDGGFSCRPAVTAGTNGQPAARPTTAV